MRGSILRPLLRPFVLGAALALSILGCSFTASTEIPPVQASTDNLPTSRPRAAPWSQQPAASICAEPGGSVARVTIFPVVPGPQCLRVTVAQHLELSNARGGPIQITIGDLEAGIMPGQEHRFEVGLGDYLLPGVHPLLVDPRCGPEIRLVVAN